MNSRKYERHPILGAGTILFRGSRIDCAIVNISIGGANIEVDDEWGIPDSFHLLMAGEIGDRLCRVVWRNERRIGVTFEQNGRGDPRPVP